MQEEKQTEQKRKIYYLYGKSSEEFIESLRASSEVEDILFVPFETKCVFPNIDRESISHLIVSGGVEEIKLIVHYAQQNNISLGLVPLENQKRVAQIFALPTIAREAFALAQEPSDKKIDLLYCNEKLVIDDIRIGNTSALKEFEYHYPKYSLFKRVQLFWQSLRHKNILKHSKFTITTHKNEHYKLSALGIIVLGYNNFSPIAKILKQKLSAIDGQQTLLILAPTSLIEYFVSNPISLFWRRWSSDKIPSSWGCMKSSRIEIHTAQQMKVIIDDQETISTPVVVETKVKALRLSVGKTFWRSQPTQQEQRSHVKLGSIPRDAERMSYFSRGLPLFKHASTQQYATLFA